MKWLTENCKKPYPDPEEKKLLAKITGMVDTPISNWYPSNVCGHLRTILEQVGLSKDDAVKNRKSSANKDSEKNKQSYSPDGHKHCRTGHQFDDTILSNADEFEKESQGVHIKCEEGQRTE